MKSVMTKSFLAFSLILFSAGFTGQSGQDRDFSRSVLPAGKVHDGWYFAAAREVLIEGTVNGDLYAAGGIVDISGTVNGDVLVAGGQVTISGTVKEDIRAGGGTVSIAGVVGGNCTVAGGSVTLAKSSKVMDNFLAACGNLRLTGRVEREAMVAAGEMGMSGSVGGGLKFAGERLALYEGATVAKNLHATVEDSLKVEIAAGSVKGTVDIDIREGRRYGGFPRAGIWFKLFWTLSLVATALVLVFLFPKQMNEAKALATEETGRTILWGFLGLIAVPVAAVIAAVTVIGIPLALFVLFLYCWFLYTAQLSLPLLFGWWIRKGLSLKGWKLFWPLAVGIAAVQVLMFIPYLRGLLLIAGMILGFGMLLVIVYRGLEDVRKV